MTDKSSLLSQLRIDRTPPAAQGGVRKSWLMAGAVGVLVIGAGIYMLLAGPGGIPVHAAVARAAVVGGSGQSGPSLLDASGYVVARRKATVSAKVTGKLVEVHVEEGQRVEEGQILAKLDDSNARASFVQAQAEVKRARAALAAAQAAYQNARPLYERNKALLERGIVGANIHEASKNSFDAAEAGLEVSKSTLEVSVAAAMVAERLVDDTVIRAPFSGVITVKAAQPGEMVSPVSAGGGFTRTGIGTIVDMDSLEVQVDVSESFISRVHSGQAASIRLNAYPDWDIPGDIIAVIPTADRAKATVQVRVGIKAKDARIIPEMGARVAFLSPVEAPTAKVAAAPAGVIVPAEAVEVSGNTGTIYLIHDNKVERRTVSLGGKNADGQTILSGVSAGDRLAVGDFKLLTDGATVHVE